MNKEGFVTKAEGGSATVLIKNHNACDACRAECGGHCDKAKLVALEAQNPIGAVRGDRVMLYSETRIIMLWAVLVFILPIIICAVAVISVSLYTDSPMVLTIVGFVSFFAVFAILHLLFKNKKDSDVFIIKEIIKGEKDNEDY